MMRNDDRAEARDIARYWENFIRDDDAAVGVTMEGAAQFAIAHALCAQAQGLHDVATAIERLVVVVRTLADRSPEPARG